VPEFVIAPGRSPYFPREILIDRRLHSVERDGYVPRAAEIPKKEIGE
jgi:hypothetical protein